MCNNSHNMIYWEHLCYWFEYFCCNNNANDNYFVVSKSILNGKSENVQKDAVLLNLFSIIQNVHQEIVSLDLYIKIYQ